MPWNQFGVRSDKPPDILGKITGCFFRDWPLIWDRSDIIASYFIRRFSQMLRKAYHNQLIDSYFTSLIKVIRSSAAYITFEFNAVVKSAKKFIV